MILRQHMVDRVRSALSHDDRRALIRLCLENGCGLAELHAGFEGSDFRYVLLKCGTDIEIGHVDDLRREFDVSLQELKQAATTLVVQDMTGPAREDVIQQAYERSRVAEVARRAELTQLRVERFVRQEEMLDEEAIAKALAEVGFVWNCGGTVQEIWSAEHERLEEEVQKKLEKQGWKKVTLP